MKNLALFTVLLFCMIGCQQKKNAPKENIAESTKLKPEVTLKKLWETDTLLKTSESILYFEQEDVLFVSCIQGVPPTAKDGDGYIAKVALDGQILDQKWTEGLHAPKGMAIVGDRLYVTNVDEVVEIALASGSILKRYHVEGAEFLNDITRDESNSLYISDSNTNKIHLLQNGELTTWANDASLGGPNGLWYEGTKMMVATFGSGKFLEISTQNLSIKEITDSIAGGDGVAGIDKGYLVSSWHGEIYFVDTNGKKLKLLDTKKDNINAADITFIATKNLLLVPTFFGNSVAAYEVVK